MQLLDAAVEATTRNTAINNKTNLIEYIYNLLFGLMGDFVKVLKSIYIYEGEQLPGGIVPTVSLFDFLIVVAVMSIVITYLVNVARRPRVETVSAQRERIRRTKGG